MNAFVKIYVWQTKRIDILIEGDDLLEKHGTI